ncbi:MAG: hypothetical protein R3290_08185 [Acidimicrobiia bacterium]|nr:hypothetical protein [Acidimicrobiia bacterium]
MPAQEPRDALADVRTNLQQAWPSLTSQDLDNLPSDRDQAARHIQEKTGADLEEIEATLSDVWGMVPERTEAPED